MKKKKSKKVVKKLVDLDEKEKQAYIADLKIKLGEFTAKIIASSKPFKCFVILQDELGNGVSKASPDFKVSELFQYLNEIVKLNSTNV